MKPRLALITTTPAQQPTYAEPLSTNARAALSAINTANAMLQRAGSGAFVATASKDGMRRWARELRRAAYLLEQGL